MNEMMESFVMALLSRFIHVYDLASLFESWLHPVTILLFCAAFPFAIISLLHVQTLHIIAFSGSFIDRIVKRIDIAGGVNETPALKRKPRNEALVEASRTRLRPILMTTSPSSPACYQWLCNRAVPLRVHQWRWSSSAGRAYVWQLLFF
jgi:multidrug efflux pump subunit AcrB